MCIHYLGQLPPIKQTKMTFFFSFTNSDNRRVEQILHGGDGISEKGEVEEWAQECEYGTSIVYICM
jgi:hypothetical protein